MSTPIKLTTSNYFNQINILVEAGKIPLELAGVLMELVNSHIHNRIRPTAEPRIVAQAKDFLIGGILLSDSACDTHYDVMVYVPDVGMRESRRQFFTLIKKYPDGSLRYLNEVS